MTKRINAHEKFRWNGWEFRQSLATSQEVHWEMRHGKLRVRVIYRDVNDPEVPPEWTAIIHFQGLEEGKGVAADYPGGSGVGSSLDRALTNAEDDFQQKLVHAVRLSGELRRGKPPDP